MVLSPVSSEIKVLEADMLDLPFSNECFDVVIEKGTMVNMKFVMFFLLDVLEFLYDALNSHNYKLSTT